MNAPNWLTLSTTSLALLAFAANSVLCRLALLNGNIDPAAFTSIRLSSGALMLLVLIYGSSLFPLKTNDNKPKPRSSNGSWIGGISLFLYAVCFSYAYVNLDAATGALILFGTVQITMICITIFKGRRLNMMEWLGFAVAILGLVYLTYPNLSSPSLIGFILMALSGVAWGVYSYLGAGSKNPLNDTGFNFIRALPMVILLTIITYQSFSITTDGLIYAISSGAITSGLGYAIWYVALPRLDGIQSSILQLSVPVITAILGVIFINEAITMRLSITSIMILGGILLVILAKKQANKKGT